jgi:hypothetical protein
MYEQANFFIVVINSQRCRAAVLLNFCISRGERRFRSSPFSTFTSYSSRRCARVRVCLIIKVPNS